MEKSNFALISALYSSEGAGLYNDVYMPIIKYTIVNLYYEAKDETRYYDVEEAQSFILSKFGIKIPTTVLRRVLVTFEKRENEMTVTTYESGSKFQIKGAWDTSVNIYIDELTQKFDSNLERLELQYQEYIKKEQVEDDKKFINFISDNTEDILGYFENNDAQKVDQRYSIMAYFLDYLNKNNRELFQAANQLFWGSIVAGFLKRNNPDIDVPKNSEKIEYYLDTALVMALLDLSTIEHKTYAEELFDIIKASGGIARIHPLTLKEITNILLSVESVGYPRVNSEIASAFERRGLSAALLAGIRVKLPQTIEALGISIMPAIDVNELTKIISSYRDKKVVRDLGVLRGMEGTTFEDNFRDVHDVYMDDFIKTQRKQISTRPFYFVTLNSDLISYCRQRSDGKPAMIHPGKIIVEMWMHSAKTSNLQNQVLTEALARCMVMNNKDIRVKLGIVSKYYNATSKNFDPETYKAIILGLFKKARKVVFYVDEVEDNLRNNKDDNENAKLIMKAGEEALLYQKRNASQLNDIQDKVDKLVVESQSQQERIESLTNANEKMQEQLDVATKDSDSLKNRLNITVQENEKQSLLIKLYQEKDRINHEIKEIESEMSSLNENMEKSVSYLSYYIRLFVMFLVVVTIVFVGFSLYYGWMQDWVGIAIGLISIIVALTQAKVFTPKVLRDNIREEQIAYWKKHHSEYLTIEEKREKLYTEMENLSEKIKNETGNTIN